MKNLLKLQRFWLVYIFSITAGIIMLISNHPNRFGQFFQSWNINQGLLVFILIVGGLFAATFQIFTETLKRKKWFFPLSQLVALPIVFIAYTILVELQYSISMPILISLFAGVFLLAISSGFLGKNGNDRFGKLVLLILQQAIITIFFALVTFIAGAILFWAVSTLIGLDIERFYPDMMVVIFFFFGIPYFAYSFPNQELKNLSDASVNVFRILLSYILIPLYLVLLVIIFFSFFKMLIGGDILGIDGNFSLAAFSIFELCLMVLINAMAEFFMTGAKSPYLKNVQKFSKFLIIPVVILIFVSAILRTMQYGLTEERYLVFLFGIWGCFVIAASFIKRIKMAHVLVLLATLLILSTFGPWGMVEVGVNAQISRLKVTLEKLGVMENNKVTTNAIITGKSVELSDFNSIVDYLRQHNSLCRVANLWPQEKHKILCQDKNNYLYVNISDLVNIPNGVEFNLPYRYTYYNYPKYEGQTNQTSGQGVFAGIDGEVILSNSYFEYSQNTNIRSPGYENFSVVKNDSSSPLRDSDQSSYNLVLSYGKESILSIDLKEFFEAVLKKYNYDENAIIPEDLIYNTTIVAPNKKQLRVKVIFPNFSVSRNDENINYISANAIVLLKYLP